MKIARRIETDRKAIEQLIEAVSGKLEPYNNFSCKIIDVADTGTANTEFTVEHNLGRVPVVYIWNIDRSGIVYDSNRATWTDTEMTLKCSVANAILKLIVI